MAKKKVGGRFGISPHSHLSPMATEALTPSMISDLLATLDACWPEQRSVPEYHPDFPGPQGEPCQVICPPPPPPSPPSFQLCDQPTATLFLGNLHYKMTEDRLVTLIHYFSRRPELGRSHRVGFGELSQRHRSVSSPASASTASLGQAHPSSAICAVKRNFFVLVVE